MNNCSKCGSNYLATNGRCNDCGYYAARHYKNNSVDFDTVTVRREHCPVCLNHTLVVDSTCDFCGWKINAKKLDPYFSGLPKLKAQIQKLWHEWISSASELEFAVWCRSIKMKQLRANPSPAT